MKRPFKSNRPLGPFAQLDTDTDRDDLPANDIRVLLGYIKQRVDDDIKTLKSMGEPSQGMEGELVSMIEMQRGQQRRMAQILRNKHKNKAGHPPRGYEEFVESYEEREELLEEMRD